MIESFEKKRESWQRKPLGAEAALGRVNKQIEVIKNLIRRGNIHKADEFLRDLIAFNLEHGEKKHVGMTLCSLAKAALDVQQFEMAERLIQYASMLEVDDAVIPCTRAEVFKSTHRLDEALIIYEEITKRFPNDVVPFSGRAEVLKGMGRLPDALAAYDDAILRFPNDAVPYNGRAEVLKQMEHFEEALAAYNQAIIRFPYNAVSRSGRAGVLILMGRHEEAASLLPHANLLSKSSWINYHISAMACLKAGDIDEAIKRLEYGLQNVPWVRFKNFFATALAVAKIKKKAFGEVVEIFQNNVVYVDIFERQKHLLLISHSQAELGNEEDAANALAAVEYLQNPHIARLRDAISHHYRLGRITPRLAPKVEIPSPENDIDKEEFFLAVAA